MASKPTKGRAIFTGGVQVPEGKLLIGNTPLTATAAQLNAAGRTQTFVDEVTFEDFTLAPGESPSWPGVAPWRTIAADQVVLDCHIVVTELFNDTASPTEIQVTNDPEGDGTQLSNAPSPVSHSAGGAHGPTTDGAVHRYPTGTGDTQASTWWLPVSGPITPIVGLNAFNGDGTTGRALLFTTIYTPPA